ncbi:MAG: glycosyltransferase family 9 protein [Verrucomicrobiae bacterium]|nr:glycosyltransferase family 9 protein [Verrucomicrobiae bacterium]
MADSDGFIRKVGAPFAGVFNRLRLGLPTYYFHGTGGIGDDLMCTTVFRELKKRSPARIAMNSGYPGLFQNNSDVNYIIHHSRPRLDYWLRAGLPFVRMGYARYFPETDGDEPLSEHVLIKLCRLAKISGPIELRPYLFLTREEFAAGKVAEYQVAIQSSGLGAPHPMRNKEWYPQRFQEVCSELRADVSVVQLGSASDPKMEGAIDLRGKTTMRQSAAILANSLVFVGLEGFLMHLARAVDCRSVIIYGGRLKPSQIGYVANKNLYTQVRCAPCWLRNPCEFDRKCMDMITVPQVIAATAEQISKYGTLLEVQTANL